MRNRNKPGINQYYGVRGWLIFVALGLFSSIFWNVVLFVNTLEFYSPNLWSIFTDPMSEAYHPLFSLFAISISISSIIFILFCTYLLVLMFQHSYKFPKMVIAFLLVQLIFFLFISTLSNVIFDNIPIPVTESNAIKGEYYKAVFQSIVQCLIWIPYFLVSKRVKATYLSYQNFYRKPKPAQSNNNIKETNNSIDESNPPQRHSLWRIVAISSITVNLLVIFILLLNNAYNEPNGSFNENAISVQSEIEPGYVSREEYDELQYDLSILEESLTEMNAVNLEMEDYIIELENWILDQESDINYDLYSNYDNDSNHGAEMQDNINNNEMEIDEYFTLGSTQHEVELIMGTPDSIIGDMWTYDSSHIRFQNGEAVGWSNLSNNLKVKVEKVNTSMDTFSLGSSHQDVIDVMGTPDFIIGDIWGYDSSHVRFQNGEVVGWSNLSNNLKIE